MHEPRSLHFPHIAHEKRRLLHEALPSVDDDLAGTEDLAGDVGRAGGGAPAALGAGVTIEQLFPRQVLDVGRAELLHTFCLEIEKGDGALRRQPLRVREVDVGNGADDVEMLGVREVVEEREQKDRMSPPTGVVRDRSARRIHSREDVGERMRHEFFANDRRGLIDEQEGVGEEHRHHESGDRAQDQYCVRLLEPVTPKPSRPQHEPAEQGKCHGEEHENAEDVL